MVTSLEDAAVTGKTGGLVAVDLSMSLDGFIAGPSDDVQHLFGWFGNGDVEVPSATPQWTFQVSEASAGHLRDAFENVGALICGRRLFDLTNGWGGTHPMGVPVFVVTHTIPEGREQQEAPFTFVTDGIESAVAQAKKAAGGKTVAVATPDIAQQCLNAGLLDEIVVSLIPVLLGDGVPFFKNFQDVPVKLELRKLIEGKGVTHMYYRVLRSGD